MINAIIGTGVVGAASRYGSDQKMRLRLRNTEYMLGIPRCASKKKNFKIFDFIHRGHCLYIVSDFLNCSPLDGLLRLNALSVFTSTLGTPGPVLLLQRPLAGRLPPLYFSSSLVQALLVNTFSKEVLPLIFIYATTCIECSCSQLLS
jgi:hypothetical protein